MGSTRWEKIIKEEGREVKGKKGNDKKETASVRSESICSIHWNLLLGNKERRKITIPTNSERRFRVSEIGREHCVEFSGERASLGTVFPFS